MSDVTVPSYTQGDLDEDIRAIEGNLWGVAGSVNRIIANWSQVQHLHPGVDAVTYIRATVPTLARNTAAAVALVEAGTTTISDAARLTGMTQSAISRAAKASRIEKGDGGMTPLMSSPAPTLKTGKPHTGGRRIGTPAAKPRTGLKKREQDPVITAFLAFLRTQRSVTNVNTAALKRVDATLHAHFARNLITCQHEGTTK